MNILEAYHLLTDPFKKKNLDKQINHLRNSKTGGFTVSASSSSNSDPAKYYTDKIFRQAERFQGSSGNDGAEVPPHIQKQRGEYTRADSKQWDSADVFYDKREKQYRWAENGLMVALLVGLMFNVTAIKEFFNRRSPSNEFDEEKEDEYVRKLMARQREPRRLTEQECQKFTVEELEKYER